MGLSIVDVCNGNTKDLLANKEVSHCDTGDTFDANIFMSEVGSYEEAIALIDKHLSVRATGASTKSRLARTQKWT